MDTLHAHWSDLVLVWVAFAFVVGSPGPSTLAIMGTSMSEGRARGLILALGVSAGSFTWGLLAALGLSALLARHANAIYAIKISGGLYLLFLGWRAAKSALDATEASPAVLRADSASTTFARGYLMHLTNPKAILGWTAIMAIGVKPDLPLAMIATLLAGCLMISLMFNYGYAVIFSSAPMIAGYRKARRSIQALLAVVFGVTGLRLLLSRA